MPKVKCHVLKYGTKDNRFWLKTDALEELIGGFGNVPEEVKEASDNQKEIEIEYHINESGGKKYYNYGPEKKGGFRGSGIANEILKTLVLPKLSVCVEKTIQENSYEPKKISVHISQHVENVDPDKIRAMIDLAEMEVLQKIREKPAVTEPTQKPAEGKDNPFKPADRLEKPENKPSDASGQEESTIDRIFGKKYEEKEESA